MKTFILISVTALTIICMSCTSLKVPSSYIIDEASLRDSLGLNEKNLILFWTDWCGASHQRIQSNYLPLNEEIKKQNLPFKIVLLASDSNISLDEIDQYRNRGISCFYIDKPGSFAIANRTSIKRFINNCFPDNEVEQIKGVLYGIPVELLVNKDLEIINETETNKSHLFINQILKNRK